MTHLYASSASSSVRCVTPAGAVTVMDASSTLMPPPDLTSCLRRVGVQSERARGEGGCDSCEGVQCRPLRDGGLMRGSGQCVMAQGWTLLKKSFAAYEVLMTPQLAKQWRSALQGGFGPTNRTLTARW